MRRRTCLIDTECSAEGVSLAETIRSDMHPADQTFAKLLAPTA
jgi:hypothetical protein